MRRIIAILLALSMLCLCGCGAPAESAPSTTEVSTEETPSDIPSVPVEEETIDLGIGGLPILP